MYRNLTMRYPSTWHREMWREAAPCGNGTVSALVYGGINREIITFNHAALWHGGALDELPDVSAVLSETRRLLDANDPVTADGVLSQAIKKTGYNAKISYPLPLGDLTLRNHSIASPHHYRRTVRMNTAEVALTWEADGVHFAREIFVSRADGLCYLKVSADRPGSLNLSLAAAQHDTETQGSMVIPNVMTAADGDRLSFSADNINTVYEPSRGSYGIASRLIPDGGSMRTEGDRIYVDGADSLLVVTKIFIGAADRDDALAEAHAALDNVLSYEEALAAHTAIHKPLFEGVDFSITDEAERSNEELLLEAFDGEVSDQLVEKMYAFGRYLFLISTGDKGELPCHLLGLCNGNYAGMWAFHMFNVNFEMIYWQALSGNLPGFLRSALDYVEAFLPDFRENAKKMYGCRGIYINSVNTPESGITANLSHHIVNWTTAAPWVCQHFYDYVRCTGDEAYLREHALPFMAETALFFEDFLYEGKDGRYEFSPSVSPENTPLNIKIMMNARATSQHLGHYETAKNAAMDVALVRELLMNLLEGSEKTGLYADKRETWKTMLEKLPDYKINEHGALKEWGDDFYEDNNDHRHHSHLYGVFPGHSVTPDMPIWDAFVKAEDDRMEIGLNNQSSWSMVYMAGVNARMQRGDKALFALSEMIRFCCMNNLLTVHNDWRRMGPASCEDLRVAPFQIDANIGFPGAVNEMLLGSADGSLTILPALPARWKRGHVSGLLAMGGYSVSIKWDGDRAEAVITGKGEVTVQCGAGWTFENGERTAVITPDLRTAITLLRTVESC